MLIMFVEKPLTKSQLYGNAYQTHTLIHMYRIFANISIGVIAMKAWKLLHYIAEMITKPKK